MTSNNSSDSNQPRPKSASTAGQVKVETGIYRYGVDGDLYAITYTVKGKKKWVRGFRTLVAARKARTKVLAELDAGSYVRPDRGTVAEFYAEWEPATRNRLRDSSAVQRAHRLEKDMLPYLGEVRLQDLTPGHVIRWQAILLGGTERLGTSQHPLAASTVAGLHTMLSTMLKDAVKWGKVASNVVTLVDPPKIIAPPMSTWSAEEVGTFIGYVREHAPRWLPLFMLLASTGCRRGEAVAVTWQDLDLDAGVWHVRRGISLSIGQVFENPPKTRAGLRTIALDTPTRAALAEYRRDVALAALSEGRADALAGDSRVFPPWFVAAGHNRHWRAEKDARAKYTAQLGVISPWTVTDRFGRMSKAAGLPRIRLHDLRHTAASLALALGQNPKVVQERLGHSSVAITLSVYSHVSGDVHRSAAEELAAVMFGGPAAGTGGGVGS